MLYFNLVGTIADVDETTTENPSHITKAVTITATSGQSAGNRAQE